MSTELLRRASSGGRLEEAGAQGLVFSKKQLESCMRVVGFNLEGKALKMCQKRSAQCLPFECQQPRHASPLSRP